MAKWVYRAGSRLQLFHVYSAAPHSDRYLTTDKYTGTMLAKTLLDALRASRLAHPTGTTLIGIAASTSARTPTSQSVAMAVGVLYPNDIFLNDMVPAQMAKGDLKFPKPAR